MTLELVDNVWVEFQWRGFFIPIILFVVSNVLMSMQHALKNQPYVGKKYTECGADPHNSFLSMWERWKYQHVFSALKNGILPFFRYWNMVLLSRFTGDLWWNVILEYFTFTKSSLPEVWWILLVPFCTQVKRLKISFQIAINKVIRANPIFRPQDRRKQRLLVEDEVRSNFIIFIIVILYFVIFIIFLRWCFC